MRNSPSSESNRHHPYPGHERPAARAIHTLRCEEPPRTAMPQAPACKTTQNSVTAGAPVVMEDVVMEPVGIATQGTQSIAPTMPAAPATVPLLRMPAGPTPACMARPEKHVPIPMANYQYVDQATGI